ncbi:ATP-binding cassette domain-containing protein [Antarctobacter heliothermus]|uniref:Putative thiamine transport system ATP-binding protein n=1 Tax=Antarctobacter heliothermus TaxID=74033 RepID=A0A239HXM5_9RHOB|nr:ATP-binding cassette domain-containing protein [Antarctobacter heliothermus]SNS86039.1 putative thiamine transport system ATP-binding protein [Antarctobacter heliothermus]
MSLDLDALSIRSAHGGALFSPLSLQVPAGHVVTVMGPSGVGKSTLLDAIGGHLAHGFHLTGTVRLNGCDVTGLPAEARRIGLMFQDALLFPHLSIGDNLAFGLPPSLRGRAHRRAAVEAALSQGGLAGLYERDPATLSGGQRARAALMRTLLAEPAALLLDEPFSKLDAGLRGEMRRFTFDHVKSRAVPTLMVTHDPDDAAAAGGPVIALKGLISP